MDDLVLPDTPITDYNTRYSGITADMMAGVTRTLRDAQRSLFSYMGPDTLLVGCADVTAACCTNKASWRSLRLSWSSARDICCPRLCRMFSSQGVGDKECH